MEESKKITKIADKENDGSQASVRQKTSGLGALAVEILDGDGNQISSLGGIVGEAYDYVSVNYSDSVTEIYTYKLGGSGGTTAATVTVVYTDSTKANLSTVTKA